ncbi:hypothetical protein HY450_02625 [Candidatus Pacearchaeota archaeon]|nr:hypothetical protein [Candidatus Pacearchaeota archaeon]
MRIAICGSMTFSPEMLEVGKSLRELGHIATLPDFTEHYATLETRDSMHVESAHNKVEHDLIRGYFNVIKDHDAVLIYNHSKNGIENYVGGNTLIEMAFAHVLRKPIFMYNPIPDMNYRDEIEAMEPIVLNGDLRRIK